MDASTEKIKKDVVKVLSEKKKTVFIKELKKMYLEISYFLENTDFTTKEDTIDITEEGLGTYKVPALTISDKNGEVVSIVPIGACIIAAQGRADIVGEFGNEAFLLFTDKGGPVIKTRKKVGDKYETHKKAIFKGVDEPGWYWLESTVRSRAQKLNKELLLDLISIVNDD
ncbi:MAG: hypothetical protein HQL03_05545 [Nitrospirae bacterium]|nr:hypothetical protein [Nitrospirota bacterium]MBF0592053.1 hypothetical protein [Nitrospirota bacterium]